MEKHKILFIVTEFWQAGGQRYTYEIDRALDKDNFESSFLSYRDLGTKSDWDDYYYDKHVELGSEVYFYSSFDKEESLLHPSKRNVLKRKKAFNKLNEFFDNYDTILLQGEWVYAKFKMIFNANSRKKCHISMLNSISQFPQNYAGFNKNDQFNFISAFNEEAVKFELQGFSSYKHFYFPLGINFSSDSPKWNSSSLNKKRIGIFTRLTKTKPIDPFIYAFQVLLSHDPNYELYIYGNGDPEQSGIMNHIRFLNLQDKIQFRGHQKEMIEVALKDEIGLTWFLGFHGMPAGFAGYDICSIGLPQLFWDLKPNESSNSNVIPMYTNLVSLAEKTNDLFNNHEQADALSIAQYKYVKEEIDIASFIKSFEEYILNS